MRGAALLQLEGLLRHSLSLDNGKGKEAFVKGFNWIVNRPTCGDHQLRLSASMAIRMMRGDFVLDGEVRYLPEALCEGGHEDTRWNLRGSALPS